MLFWGMKTILFNNLIKSLLLVAVTICLAGCKPPTKADVIGTYTHSNQGANDKIVLNPDGTFQQEVKYADGRVWTMTNSWTLINQNIQLNECYQVFDEETKAALNQPKHVGMCSFTWEGNGFSRDDGQLLWLKSSSASAPIQAVTIVIAETNTVSSNTPDKPQIVQPPKFALNNSVRKNIHNSEAISSDGKITASNSASIIKPTLKMSQPILNPMPVTTNGL
jgi:hypothetical protein